MWFFSLFFNSPKDMHINRLAGQQPIFVYYLLWDVKRLRSLVYIRNELNRTFKRSAPSAVLKLNDYSFPDRYPLIVEVYLSTG